MSAPGERLPYERQARELIAAYRHAQRDIAAQVRAALAAGNLALVSQRQAQLAALVALLDRLGVQTDPLARRVVADAFAQSAAVTQLRVARLRVDAPEIPGSFAGISQEAVVALQDSLTGRLQGARANVGRSVDDLYARAGRHAALQAVLGAQGSPRSASRAMMRDLMRDPQIRRSVMRGGAGFVDRAGRQWGLENYADMAVRTTTRQAVVEGAKARMASHGINLARVSVSPNPCPICRPWQGRLISLDGSTTSYEGEAVADLSSLPNGGPPMHPRCTHSLQPVAVRIDALRRELAGVA